LSVERAEYGEPLGERRHEFLIFGHCARAYFVGAGAAPAIDSKMALGKYIPQCEPSFDNRT
jgi:hypothetical protein